MRKPRTTTSAAQPAEQPKPNKDQLKEWEQSRQHENDGSYRGDFGGPVPGTEVPEPEGKGKPAKTEGDDK